MAAGLQVFDGSTHEARVKVKNTFIDIDDCGEIETRCRHRGYSTLPVDFDQHANARTQTQGYLNAEAELPILLGSITAAAQPEQKCGSADQMVRFDANRRGCVSISRGSHVKVKNTFIEIENDDAVDDIPANRRRNFRTSPDVSHDVAVEEACTDASSRPNPWERSVCFGAEDRMESQRVRFGSARASRRNNFGTEDLRELLMHENVHPWKIDEQQTRIGESEQYSEEEHEARSVSRAERQIFYRTRDCFEPLKVQGSLPAASRWDEPPPVWDASSQRSPSIGQKEHVFTSTGPSHVASHAHGVGPVATTAAPAVLGQQRFCEHSAGRLPNPLTLHPPGMDQLSSHPFLMMPPWAFNHASMSCGQADFLIGGPVMHLHSPVARCAPPEVPQTLLLEHHTRQPSLPSGAVAANSVSLSQPVSRPPMAFVPMDSVNTATPAAQASLSPTFPTSGTLEASGNAAQGIEAMICPTPEEFPLTTLGTAIRHQNKRPLRLWAHIYLHMVTPGFDLVPMLIGRGGANMRKIAEATNAKIRVRGRGSGHLEVNGTSEAPTPLMVAVTSDKRDNGGFKRALEMTVAQLRVVERRYRAFCEKETRPVDGPCFSIGLLTDGAEELLGDALEGVPFGHIARGGALVLGRGSNRVGSGPTVRGGGSSPSPACVSSEGACVSMTGVSASVAVAVKHTGGGDSVRAQPR
jgi:hypothetical protein|eukprot:TRINITY_DN74529_c0_g1_i1.p1 TRINITY_DN74529_c0_g1~~TRINITY_DN74529_c0_g1_i1.p1  ORF type:complete len:737 (-),score=71.56 TRINITY_DN74529_c0_g1_i1:233-2314(-)